MANYYKILEPGEDIPPGVFSTGDVDAAEAENLYHHLFGILMAFWAVIHTANVPVEDAIVDLYPTRGQSQSLKLKVALDNCVKVLERSNPAAKFPATAKLNEELEGGLE